MIESRGKKETNIVREMPISHHHTWFNKHAHIFRTDGRVVRATMKEIVLERDAIYIRTEFLDDTGMIKTKDTSPITVAALQVLWVNVDVVSDMELPDDFDIVTNFVPPRECDRLPPLDVYMNKTPAMKCMLLQVDHFLGVSTPLATTPPPPPLPFQARPRRRRSARHRRGQDISVASAGP
jgi:hypothetical protein